MYESKFDYDRFATSTFIWEIVFATIVMGLGLLVVNLVDCSDANKIISVIALATIYVGGTVAHGIQSMNAQIHCCSEFVVKSISEMLSEPKGPKGPN